MIRDAHVSDDGRMRYWLSRDWGRETQAGPLIFILLNPSTADAATDDPTVRKCIKFAKRLGYNCLYILNLFPFRATNPKALKAACFPNDETNDNAIKGLTAGGNVICGWGRNAFGHPRAAEVLAMLRAQGNTPYAFRMNYDGTPAHPLYLPDNSKLIAIP